MPEKQPIPKDPGSEDYYNWSTWRHMAIFAYNKPIMMGQPLDDSKEFCSGVVDCIPGKVYEELAEFDIDDCVTTGDKIKALMDFYTEANEGIN